MRILRILFLEFVEFSGNKLQILLRIFVTFYTTDPSTIDSVDGSDDCHTKQSSLYFAGAHRTLRLLRVPLPAQFGLSSSADDSTYNNDYFCHHCMSVQSQFFQSQTILQTIRSLKKSQKMSSLKNPKMERSFERSFYRENIV